VAGRGETCGMTCVALAGQACGGGGLAAPPGALQSLRFVGLQAEGCSITGVLVSASTELVAVGGPRSGPTAGHARHLKASP
jgi:hypothetical protein